MATVKNRANTFIGLQGPLQNEFPHPIVTNRDPDTFDRADAIGQIWVNTAAQSVFVSVGTDAAGLGIWSIFPGGAELLTALVVTPGSIQITAGDLLIDAGDATIAGTTTTNELISLDGTFNGTLDVVGVATFADDVVVNGDLAITGDFDIVNLNQISITSTSALAAGILLTVNGGVNETLVLRSLQGTGADSITLTSQAGGVTLRGALGTAGAITLDANDTAGGGMTALANTGGFTFTAINGVFTANTGTGVVGISTDAAATTINIGTGAAVIKTISLGGTGANVIAIGNTQTAGSIALGTAMTTGTISIGGTGLQTGNFDLAPGTGAQTVTLANGAGIKTISIGNGVSGNTITIGNGINTAAQTISIGNGASAANSTVNILSGVATAGVSTLNLGNGNYAKAINIGNGTLGNTILIGNGINSVAQILSLSNGAAAADSTVNILSGNATAGTQTLNLAAGTGGKVVHIADGAGINTVTIANGASANTVTIGSTNTTSTTTINAGTGRLALVAGGMVSVQTTTGTVASPTATIVLNTRVGKAVFTGFTTAAAAAQVFTITDSEVTAASAILVSAANLGANDAQMTVTRVVPGVGTFDVTLTNYGAAALNGNVVITFWVVAA